MNGAPCPRRSADVGMFLGGYMPTRTWAWHASSIGILKINKSNWRYDAAGLAISDFFCS
jgi:hypothetical protein